MRDPPLRHIRRKGIVHHENGEAAGEKRRVNKGEKLTPRHEGPAHDEVAGRVGGEVGFGGHGLHIRIFQVQGAAGLNQEHGPLLPLFNHGVAPLRPEEAERDAGQSGARAEIENAGLPGQGQTFEEGGEVETVGHKKTGRVLPGFLAHEVHDAVPGHEHVHIGDEAGQDLGGDSHARSGEAVPHGLIADAPHAGLFFRGSFP